MDSEVYNGSDIFQMAGLWLEEIAENNSGLGWRTCD
jgi:hypothetical protein